MRALKVVVIFAAAVLAACVTVPENKREELPAGALTSPETVMVTYYVKPGSESALQAVLAKAWGIYTQMKLVKPQQHVVVRVDEKSGKVRFTEIFTWLDTKTPDNAPAAVKQVWEEMKPLCEAREGHRPMEGGEVSLLAY